MSMSEEYRMPKGELGLAIFFTVWILALAMTMINWSYGNHRAVKMAAMLDNVKKGDIIELQDLARVCVLGQVIHHAEYDYVTRVGCYVGLGNRWSYREFSRGDIIEAMTRVIKQSDPEHAKLRALVQFHF